MYREDLSRVTNIKDITASRTLSEARIGIITKMEVFIYFNQF